jgi:hypothetical protein
VAEKGTVLQSLAISHQQGQDTSSGQLTINKKNRRVDEMKREISIDFSHLTIIKSYFLTSNVGLSLP